MNIVTAQPGPRAPARTTPAAWSCAASAGSAHAPSTHRSTSQANPAATAAQPAESPNTADSTCDHRGCNTQHRHRAGTASNTRGRPLTAHNSPVPTSHEPHRETTPLEPELVTTGGARSLDDTHRQVAATGDLSVQALADELAAYPGANAAPATNEIRRTSAPSLRRR